MRTVNTNGNLKNEQIDSYYILVSESASACHLPKILAHFQQRLLSEHLPANFLTADLVYSNADTLHWDVCSWQMKEKVTNYVSIQSNYVSIQSTQEGHLRKVELI